MTFLQHPENWLLPFIIIELVLKGIALWKAARNNQSYWFIALIVINSVGIVPLVYINFFQRNLNKKSKSSR